MIDQLFQQFSQSAQGQEAMKRLSAQGFDQGQAMQVMQSAFPATAQAMHGAAQPGREGPGLMDIGDSHYITNFLSGAVSSLVRGQGIKGAAIDGLQGVVGGHVAQVIAGRFGFPQRLAGTIGAIIVPLMIDFIWDKVKKKELSLAKLFSGGEGGGPSKMALAGGAVAAAGAGAAIAAGAMHMRNKSQEAAAQQQAAAQMAAQQQAAAQMAAQQQAALAAGAVQPMQGARYPAPAGYAPGYAYPAPMAAMPVMMMPAVAMPQAAYRPLPGGVPGLGGVQQQQVPAYLRADPVYAPSQVKSVHKMFQSGGN